jgi:prenyltransferase beta subunit
MNHSGLRTRSGSTLWAFDAGLLLLGGLVLMLVVRLLRFDDLDPWYNAWTYLLAVPTVLIATSMLTRVIANDVVEKSIQLGFLISVLVHLLFTFFAINVVLFSDFWPANVTKVAMASTSPSKAPQYHEPSSTLNASRPDYLKPVKTEQNTAQNEIEPQKQPDEPAPLDAMAAKDSVEPQLADKPFETARKEAAPSQPAISSTAKQLDRPDTNKPIEESTSPIDVPKIERSQPSPPASLEALQADASRSNSDSKPSIQIDDSLTKNIDLDIRPKQNVAPKLSNRQAADASRNDSELEKAIHRTAESLPLRPNAVQPPRTPSDASDLARFSVPVPNTKTSPSQDSSGKTPPTERDTAVNMRSKDATIGGSSSAGISQTTALPTLQPSLSRASELGLKQRATSNDARLPSESEFLSDARFSQQSQPRNSSSRPQTESSMAPATSQPIATDSIVGNTGSSASSPASDLSEVMSNQADIGRLERSSADSSQVSRSKDGRSTVLDSVVGSPAFDVGPDRSAAAFLDAPFKGRDTIKHDIAMPEIKDVDVTVDRFKRPDVGGPKIANSAVPIPAPAFSQRLKRNREDQDEASQELGPLGPQTEAAIEKGLEFLSKFQRTDGSWHLEDFGERVDIRSPTAATALALLSFQGAGYTHQQFKYERVCSNALKWLIAQQRPSGDLYVKTDPKSDSNSWLYSHAIATLALCETYGMTQDPEIKENAQRAINFLVQSQDPQGGGWRYQPKIGSDTSVTGWCMMAMKSAELSGLEVPKKTYAGIEKWLNGSQAGEQQKFLYRYNWQAADVPATRHGRVPTPVMTSVGLLMRLYLGWRRDNNDMTQGAEWLLQRLPAEGTIDNPQRDTYFWYYATQVLFHMGGDQWKKWYGSLYPMLIQTQAPTGKFAGSWEPNGRIPDAWGRFGGRLYVTTLNLLSLEVYYRHLPIYDATAD